MSAVLAFLGALPELLHMIKQFMEWINHISGNDPAGWAKQVGEAFAKVNAAQTQEERADAAKGIADLISRLP